MVLNAALCQAFHTAGLARCEALESELKDLDLVAEEMVDSAVVRGVDCPGVRHTGGGKDRPFEPVMTQVVQRMKQYLSAALLLLLKMSGLASRYGPHPLAIDEQQWCHIVAEVAVKNPRIAQAMK